MRLPRRGRAENEGGEDVSVLTAEKVTEEEDEGKDERAGKWKEEVGEDEFLSAWKEEVGEEEYLAT